MPPQKRPRLCSREHFPPASHFGLGASRVKWEEVEWAREERGSRKKTLSAAKAYLKIHEERGKRRCDGVGLGGRLSDSFHRRHENVKLHKFLFSRLPSTPLKAAHQHTQQRQRTFPRFNVKWGNRSWSCVLAHFHSSARDGVRRFGFFLAHPHSEDATKASKREETPTEALSRAKVS